jgi:replicative DNA helicase
MTQSNKDFEETILGALIEYPHILINIQPVLKIDYFYHYENKVVLRAIYNLLEDNKGIDLITVVSQVRKMNELENIGGSIFVSSLTTKHYINPDLTEEKVRAIHQLYMLRELKGLGEKITTFSIEPKADPFKITEMLEAKLTEIVNIRNEKIKSVGDIFIELVDEIKEVLEKGIPTGILTGLRNLDVQTGGWQNGNLVIVAGRPGMGKTATCLQFAKFPASQGLPVAIFSLEMTGHELTGRLASSESNISSTLINQKKLDRFQLNQLGANCMQLMDMPIYIDDTAGLTISDLKNKAKKLFYERGIKLIIIDYLQLMRGEGEGNREQEISSISRGLKTLAKDLNIPVIALAQLNRQCESRADKRPILSDLRDGGSIEQDADIVSFLFRPEMYRDIYKDGYELGSGFVNIDNLMLFDISKGRGLKTGEVPLKFFGEFMQISNYDVFDKEPF